MNKYYKAMLDGYHLVITGAKNYDAALHWIDKDTGTWRRYTVSLGPIETSTPADEIITFLEEIENNPDDNIIIAGCAYKDR